MAAARATSGRSLAGVKAHTQGYVLTGGVCGLVCKMWRAKPEAGRSAVLAAT